MAELRPSSRMKLVQRRAHHDQHLRSTFEKVRLYLKKYFKWILWILLTVYFFFSTTTTFSSSSSFHPFPLKPTPSLEPISRALIENQKNSPPSLRIYVYDLPSRFNGDWLADSRCRRHLFAAEVALHEALLQFSGRVLDPEEADFFFVPVYVSCNFSTPNGFPSLGHARPLISAAVDLVAGEYPFWNRSDGRDHVFVAAHDYGACFHAMEDVAIADGIPEIMKRSIILQTFGVNSPHPCQQAQHVMIPPYVMPDIEEQWPAPETVKRDIFAFFRGKMEVHPKNVSGRFYGRKVRTEIWRRYSGNRKFYLRRKRFDGYRTEIARSIFCLCPLGWAPWSPRLVEAVALGCVPVIIADDIRLPFPETVKWHEISLTVAERDVLRLETVLDDVAATNLSAIQRNLWDPARRRALLFRLPMAPNDATWHVLRALEAIRPRRELLRRGATPVGSGVSAASTR